MSAVEEYLERIPMWAAKKNSLEDVRAYLEEMGSPDRGMKIIHVAGTNGKGSVCSYLTSMLTETGYKVGTFISPHLEEIRERFLMNGDLVREDTYERAFYRVKELSEKMVEKGYQPPTYFEFLFYMCMAVNEQCKPDFVILETGLGGRLDVTNVVEHPVLTVITSISMDHMQYLGNTIEEIAGEKAGILKPGVPVVYDGVLRRKQDGDRGESYGIEMPEDPGRTGCLYLYETGCEGRLHRSPDVGWRSACGDSAVPGGISADERFCRSEGYEYPSEKWSLLVFSGRYCPGNFTGILAGTDGTGASGSLSGRSPQRRWY